MSIFVRWANTILMLIFRFRHFFTVLVTVIFLNNHGFTQERGSEMGMPFITSYKSSDYGGESQNWAFCQDNNGVLYVANTIGILEFDGVSWRQFKPHNDGIPISFSVADDGEIYCSGTGFIGKLGIDSLGRRSFISLNHTLPDNLYIDFIWKTYCLKSKVYFQNKQSVLVYDGEKTVVVETESDIESLLIFEGEVIVDAKNGSYRLEEENLVRLDWLSFLPNSRITFLHRTENGILIGTYKQGLFLFDDGKSKPISSELNTFIKSNFATSYLRLPDGKIAIGTKRAGVVIINKDLTIYYRINKAGGLAFDDVRGLFFDNQDNFWMATDNGISRLKYPIEFTYYKEDNGVESTIEEIRRYNGDLYIGTFTGTYRLTPASQSKLLSDWPYADFERLEGSGLSNLALFEFNKKLLIGSSVGTKIYDGKTLQPFDDQEARKFYLSEYHKNLLVETHRNGADLLVFDAEGVKQRIPIIGISDQIRGVAEDKDGVIWLGSFTNGVYSLKVKDDFTIKEIEHYSEKDGLPSMRDNLVYRVGDKVYFTTHQGIYVFNDELKMFSPDSTFGKRFADNSRFVYAFYEDNNKNVWLNSFRKGETTLATFVNDEEYLTNQYKFTLLNKLNVYEIFSDDSSAWFGGSDGLARYRSKDIDQPKVPFLAKIRKVIVNGDSLLFAGHQKMNTAIPILSAEDNELRFESAAIYYDESNEYQYRLLGDDQLWSSWISEPFKIYTNLSQGEYTFQVKAKNIKGIVSAPDSFKFKILPPWYLTWWFLTLSSMISLLILIYIIRYLTTRKLIKRVEELELIQKAQTQRERISRDLHDNVGSNLTYIISSLDYLTFKSGKDKKISEKANNLSEFTRDTMHQLRDTIWHISSEEVTLVRFLKRIEELCLRLNEINETTACFVRLEGNPDLVLPPLPALNLFRVVQESVNNAFKHAEAKNIHVTMQHDSSHKLTIVIKDDGIGFNVKTSDFDGHYGLINLKSRMSDIGATLDISSKIGEGTTVKVTWQL